ncbi:hypothetical protein [Mangrovibacterium marinum]|uniref:Uncharacterized protein n=1 Tax=Mangrovibacterium marinum TaxID=1639118 RepID=A0A2T5BXR3_9BACT|nr:hypothetical protein [Mangrovibacterium marinum]PTN05944.1 hypothetical protein C8N47_1247 [Mangrovibacterium marinum]
MAERKLGQRCPHANQCPVFAGKHKTPGLPLFLYRNVFCHRGQKGWDNCQQYKEFEIPENQKPNSV